MVTDGMDNVLFAYRSVEQSHVQQQRRQEAATLFRQRHQISQEDMLSSGSFEDLRSAVGTVETPAVLQVMLCYVATT